MMKFNKQKGFIQHYLRRSSAGFTLMELLIVMSIVLVVGSIIIAILFSSLRGSSKAKALDTVRRNGNYAIEQMTKSIKYAESVEGVSQYGDIYTSTCLPLVASVPASSLPDKPNGVSLAQAFENFSTGIGGTISNFFPKQDNSLKENNSKGLFALDLKGFLSPLFGKGGKEGQKGEVAASYTEPIVGTTNDKWMRYNKTTHPADTSGTCSETVPATSTFLNVGQTYSSGPIYNSYRSYFEFDTSIIPPDAEITNAFLRIFVYGKTFGTHSNIYLRQVGIPNSCNASGWGGSPPTGTNVIDSYLTSDISIDENQLDFSAIGKSLINKTGYSTYMLTTDREERDQVNSSTELFNIRSAEYTTQVQRPTLIVQYETSDISSTPTQTPTPTPFPTPNLTEYHFVKVRGFDGGHTVYSCLEEGQFNPITGTFTGIASNSSKLLNTDAVSVDSCVITCQQNSLASPPTIKIDFTLSNRAVSGGLFENKATVPFQTTFTARNY